MGPQISPQVGGESQGGLPVEGCPVERPLAQCMPTPAWVLTRLLLILQGWLVTCSLFLLLPQSCCCLFSYDPVSSPSEEQAGASVRRPTTGTGLPMLMNNE